MNQIETERYELVKQKIENELLAGFSTERTNLSADLNDYFNKQMSFLCLVNQLYEDISNKVDIEKLQEYNVKLYENILPANYERDYTNPDYAVSVFGKELGQLLSALAFELRATIPAAYESDGFSILIRLELLMEVYTTACDNLDSSEFTGALKDIIYWYISDYFETEWEHKVLEMTDASLDFARRIIMEENLDTPDYLYKYGEYITDNEIKLSEYVSRLSDEKIHKIADTFTEGYRIGFVLTGKDLSIKETVNIRYPLGMEKIVRVAIDNFKKMGLKPVIYRAQGSLFRCRNVNKIGYFGGNPNRQYDYDHMKDEALYLDGQMVTRKLECLKNAFEEHKEMAAKHAGPAVMESFGQLPFVPNTSENATKLSKEQEKLSVKYTSKAGEITNEYIKGEERSFTIIAFPVPEIGPLFETIFDATLEINTLDYMLYRNLQQIIIDNLDKAESVHIKGCGQNITDLTVSLIGLNNPEKETKFENCVADVNIPVGEVFTSPVLKGTTGTLYVSRVFLNELEYKKLKIEIKDGMITDYICENYEDEEKNKAYFKENVLYNRDSLPMGEFAIGTNTLAYKYGRQYDIEGLFPILIAEKTGPHFAFGDTCYSHAEDIKVYNPDGKEIVARDNEISINRKESMEKAYFNCHTDITLPYDEIGLLEGICKDGSKFAIIKDGRFVLPGLEELNKPLNMLK